MVAIDTPRTEEQLKEALLDEDTRKTLMESPENFAKFVSDYSAERLKSGGLAEMIKEAESDGLLAALREFNGARPPMGDPDDADVAEWSTGYVQGKEFKSGWASETWTKGQIQDVNRRVKLSHTHGFKRPAEFYRAIWHMDPLRPKEGVERMSNGFDERLKDLSINIGADGGFLIPEALRAQLLSVPLETAIVRPRAMIIPMDSLRVPFPTIDDVSHTANVFGGVVANWTDENATITENQPSFGRVNLEAKKLALYTEVPNELFMDSIISLEAFLNQIYPQAIGYFEDDAFLVGNGAGRPLGALAVANNALVSVTRDTTSEINWEDIVNMYARMLPSSHPTAVWVVNQETIPQLFTMSLDIGTGGSAVFLTNGTGGPPTSILGRPIMITEKVPALASAGDINFVDFRQYLLGDRQTITMSTSPHFKFQQDQTAIRATERVDGQPWLRSALTPRNGTNTLSPYVRLAA